MNNRYMYNPSSQYKSEKLNWLNSISLSDFILSICAYILLIKKIQLVVLKGFND